MGSNIITLDMLGTYGACLQQQDEFEFLFGKSVEVTVELAARYAETFDWDWAAGALLSDNGCEEWWERQGASFSAWTTVYQAAQSLPQPQRDEATLAGRLQHEVNKATAFAELWLSEQS